MRRFIFTLLVISMSLLSFSQETLEPTNVSDKDWNVCGNLSVRRYTNGLELINPLSLKRYRSSTVEGLTEMLSNGHPYVELYAYRYSNKLDLTDFVLSFDVKNKTIPPEREADIYSFWIIRITYIDKADRIKTSRNWVIRCNNHLHEYDYKPNSSYNGLGTNYAGGMKSCRNVKICFNNDELDVYIDKQEVTSIDDVALIQSISVHVSAGTTLCIENTKMQKLTVFGKAVPYLQKAMDYIDKNNPSSAASEMTKAIKKDLKCYDTYFMRGFAYYLQGFYKSAIEDFTSAISYSSTKKEMAYYYRGLSKLAINDYNGVSDLKNGGQDGIVILRENNLMNYTPGQKNKKVTGAPKRNTPSPTKKPTLKK